MTNAIQMLEPAVVIVGAGPAGLSAGKVLAQANVGEVLIIERESVAGGIPRHSDHPGYGIRDRRSFMSGPSYAQKLVDEAESAGARIWTQAQVVGWADEDTLEVTSPEGLFQVKAKATLLATGARERPRPARMIWGDRPAGVYTTGQLQNAVHVYHQEVGKRAVVVGAELVSWSAALTLKEANCETVALISQFPKAESYALFTHPGKLFFRTKVIPNSTVVGLYGRPRVERVEIENVETGERSTIECDTVVFTGDWIADYELAWSAGLEIDPASGSPSVDNAMRTSRPGIFATGNLNHPVETADVVALEGQFAAEQVLQYLRGHTDTEKSVELIPAGVLKWISPGRYVPSGPTPARGKLVCWVKQAVPSPVIEVVQDGRLLSRTRSIWPANPGRAFRIPASTLKHVRSDKGPVTVAVV